MGLWTLYRTFNPCRADRRDNERIYLLVILRGDCNCVCARYGQVDKGEAMSDIERRDGQGEDERALREALKQIRDYPGTSRAADYMRRIAREALRSRLSEPKE